MQTGILEG